LNQQAELPFGFTPSVQSLAHEVNMSVLQFCCLPSCGLYNPWVKGVSGDGYSCDPPKLNRTTLSIGTDFGLTTYASFTDGTPNQNPCQYSGIGPWRRDLSDTFPTAVDYSDFCDEFPQGVNYCCCGTNSLCTPAQGGTQCEWFANDNKYPGSYFTDFNLLCLKTGVDIASQTVEETNYTDCCGSVYFGEVNCGEVACGCDLLYGNTTCNRSRIAYTFGDPCTSGGPCPPYVAYQYFTDEPVLTTYYGFDAAVTAEVIDANDPLGVYEQALSFDSITGDTFTARMLLHDHLVDIVNDIIDYPGILAGFALSQGGVPDDDVTTPWGDFPDGPYSPNNAGGGYEPWVTITLTMTSGTYNGNTYTYHGYGTAQQFQIWAQTNWPPVANNVVRIVGSPNYWLGLRISSHALNTTTGQYTPFHEYRRIMTRITTQGGIPGWMPDNSDDFLLDSSTDTQVIWTARLRQFYTWRVYTTMQDKRVHGMSIESLRVATGTCCDFDHCTKTRIWWGVTGADAAVAPCTVTNPLIETAGTCGSEGSPYITHRDDCESSTCAAAQQAISYDGYCRGYTQSTCFPSQYNADMNYDFVQNLNDFECSNSACIDLP